MKAAFSILRVSPTHVGFLAVLAFAPAVLQAHDLQICKTSDLSHPVSGSFTFNIDSSSTATAPYNFSHFATRTVLVGACSEAFEGNDSAAYRITEVAVANTAVTSIKSKILYNFSPNPGGNGLLDSNLVQRTAIVSSSGAETTVVTFTNSNVSTSNQGCTPGFFKQHQHFDSWSGGFTTDTKVNTVFTGVDASLADETLLDALQGGGGPGLVGAEQILLRAAVAALLNASSAGVNYPLTRDDITSDVNTALAIGTRDVILTVATALDNYNNGSGGCPLS
jgi:hypothetical protein